MTSMAAILLVVLKRRSQINSETNNDKFSKWKKIFLYNMSEKRGF